MPPLQPPNASVLTATMDACITNGYRLLEETFDLEFRKPPSSKYFLTLIAQEEFAKAFLIHMIKEKAVPFSRPVLRAINDHICKQLVGVIMDYINMFWENLDDLKAAVERDHNLGEFLPDDVGSAMELLCYEKIGRWEASNWEWAEDPRYDAFALGVFNGKRDRRKQDALYVRIGGDGRVCATPDVITEREADEELERAQRYGSLANSLRRGEDQFYRYDKAVSAFRLLFERQNSLR